MKENVYNFVFSIIGILMIIFRKSLARAMMKSQLKKARRKYSTPEKLKEVEQIGYPVFETALIILGLLFVLVSLLAFLGILKTQGVT